MYRVLIVDDELPAQRFVRSIIEQYAGDFEVAGTAASGEQGLRFLEQNPHAWWNSSNQESHTDGHCSWESSW